MSLSPEILLISAIMKTGNHMVAPAHGITPDMFHAYPDVYEWLEGYIRSHRRTPPYQTFRIKHPEFPLKKVDDVEYWVKEVQRNHTAIILKGGLRDIIDYVRDDNLDEAIRRIQSLGMTADSRYRSDNHDSDIFSSWDAYDEIIRRAEKKKELGLSGIPTGFPTIDEQLGGIQPGWLVVVSARLGIGKTWILIRMAIAAYFSGLTLQYDALEQSRAEVAMRAYTFASSEYGEQVFRNLDLAQGKNYSPDKFKKFLESMSAMDLGRFHVADGRNGGMGAMTMAAQIERNTPDALYLDYLTLADKQSSDWQGVAQLSKDTKNLATKYQIPIIVAAQINRSGNGNEIAGPENLAESDAIGRDADLVIGMRRYSKSVIQMKATKFRHGPEPTWYVSFTPNTGELEEITRDEAIDRKMRDGDDDDDDHQKFIFTKRKKGSYTEIARKRKLAIEAGTKSPPASLSPVDTTVRIVSKTKGKKVKAS